MMMRSMVWASAFLAVGLVACTTPEGKGPDPNAVRAVALGNTDRAFVRGDVVLASQPDRDALVLARNRYGVKSVLNLRMPEEVAALHEREIVEGAGLKYFNVPFKGPETLTDAVFAKARAILADPSNRPILVHCSSANRVGAIWYAYRVLDEGADPETALEEARRIGLRKPGHEKRAKDYVAARL